MGSRPSTRLIQFPNSKPHAATGSAAKFNGVLSVIALRRHDKTLHVLWPHRSDYRSEVSSLKWFRFHPLTCAAMAVAIVVLAFLNSRCHVFFGPGSTTTLRFGHGWPVRFQEGPVPGPGQRVPNPDDTMPNYIWGHPEFNDDPKIMAKYNAELEGVPRTPWGLHALAKPSVFGAVFDTLVAFVLLAALSLLCEAAIHSADREINNFHSIASFVVILAVFAIVASVFMANAWCYALVALTVVVVSILVTGIALSRGYQ
jgi:hypothetical protein